MYQIMNNVKPSPAPTQSPIPSVYYIKLDMVDGSSQLVQITKEQAVALGIECYDEVPQANPTSQNVPTTPVYNKTQDISNCIINASDGLQFRILDPSEMHLKPAHPKVASNGALPRGRPKRERVPEEVLVLDVPGTRNPAKRLRPARTRSGRVTRPPKHIQEIFKKIVVDDTNTSRGSSASHEDSSRGIVISDFAPLRTNGNLLPPVPPLAALSDAGACAVVRKRCVQAQYRCATCHKAYLGKRRMRKHLRQFADHRPKDKFQLDSKAWDCLVDTAKLAPEGRRGEIFCSELISLLTNAKILVRYFFKKLKKLSPCEVDIKLQVDEDDDVTHEAGQYLVQELLAKALNIDKGWYTFNENELCKDVSIFSFLENFDSSVLSALSIGDKTNKLDTDVAITRADKGVVEEQRNFQFDKIENNTGNVQFRDNSIESVEIKIANDNTKKIIDDSLILPVSQNAVITHENTELRNFQFDKEENLKVQDKSMATQIENCNNKTTTIINDTLILPAIIQKPIINAITNDLNSKSNIINNPEKAHIDTTFKSFFEAPEKPENFAYPELNILQMDVDSTSSKDDIKPPTKQIDIHNVSAKKQTDVLLAKHDEQLQIPENLLICSGDSAQVNHILENSNSNSDDIINVDHFVNERFKKFTAGDSMDIQRNLDKPPLQIFQFDSNQ